MATHNTYLTYKRDTNHLIYWIIHTSNTIIKRCDPSKLRDDADAPKSLNTSGAVTVSSLVSLAKFIARHLEKTPPTILRLFRSVIDARTATHATFQMMVAKNPDPQVAKSNASHKLFIDALSAAFSALGGGAGLDEDLAETSSEKGKDELDLANIYRALNLEGQGENESGGEESDEPAKPSSSGTSRRAQPRPGKGRKGKKGKKKQQKAAQPAKKNLDDVPLESYRIIQDEEGIVTDYLMAVYDLVREWMDLRHSLQDIWREVAYDGLNGAVAGTLSNTAIAMVRQSAAAMFVDFPGHDTYETVMNTITRGSVEKAQRNYSISLFKLPHDGSTPQTVQKTYIDVKEEFLIHAYRDLLDFIADFQQTRSGKPTRRMLAEIQDWDPKFNLERATNEERMRWRRAYTINWLYDLVNVFSANVVQRINQKGERHVLEKVDWSARGPWGKHRLIFGINDFAADVTTWAMQKPGTDVRSHVLPHHVFQLQIIVDSLAVSRGWSISVLRGHVLTPPARNYRPRRDVDLFLDREGKRFGRGFLQGANVLKQLLDRPQNNSAKLGPVTEILEGMLWDFRDWLGESKYKYGLNTIPPSRFSHANSNGLWEYSPFLCGVGLTESLEMAYLIGMLIWDQVPEVMFMVHLHYMLVQRGYIEQPVGLYTSLAAVFQESFFGEGNAPESDFLKAIIDRIGPASSRRSMRDMMASRRQIAGVASTTIHELLMPENNMLFKEKSLLVTLHRANWIPDNIPDKDVPIVSAICALRLALTKFITDPATGKHQPEETVLIQRMRSASHLPNESNEDVVEQAILSAQKLFDYNERPIDAATVRSVLPKGYADLKYSGSQVSRGKDARQRELSGSFKLQLLKVDIVSDVCGSNPVSALNLVWVTARILGGVMMIEDALKNARNPLYCRIYESEGSNHLQKRRDLFLAALAGDDEDCLRIMAHTFQNPRAGYMNHIYWDDLKDVDGTDGGMNDRVRVTQAELMDDQPDGCIVM